MDFMKDWINLVDGIVLVVLTLGILGGLRRGLSGELLRVITIVIALLVGWYGYDGTAQWLSERSDWPPSDLRVVALLGLIIGTYVVLGIVRHVFRIILDFSFRGRMELLGGALLGLVRALVFCCIALLGASLIPSEEVEQAIAASHAGRWVSEYLTPAYTAWAEENPDLKLPVKGQEPGLVTEPIDLPALEETGAEVIEQGADSIEDSGEVLGPLIDDEPPGSFQE